MNKDSRGYDKSSLFSPTAVYPESDWKLFQSKYAEWNENYIDRLCKDYMEILNSDKAPSERFRVLSDRISSDRQKVGFAVRNSRSQMLRNIVDLVERGAITLDDLDSFSDELKTAVKVITDK
ncbi:MAG: multidrug transporter [Ruminiclostridium sp.]|nr:multidrug transporter [Ruminiclostridium sp.]